jgi:hypothetical protein
MNSLDINVADVVAMKMDAMNTGAIDIGAVGVVSRNKSATCTVATGEI